MDLWINCGKSGSLTPVAHGGMVDTEQQALHPCRAMLAARAGDLTSSLELETVARDQEKEQLKQQASHSNRYVRARQHDAGRITLVPRSS